MVDELDVEVGILLQDQAAEGGSLVVDGHVGQGLERRLEGGQALPRGLGTGKLLRVEGQGSVFVEHGHEAPGEVAVGDGVGGALLAHQGQVLRRLAAYALEGGDGVGADALVGLGVQGPQAQIAPVHHRRAVIGAPAVGHGHHLRSPGHHQIGHA